MLKIREGRGICVCLCVREGVRVCMGTFVQLFCKNAWIGSKDQPLTNNFITLLSKIDARP